MYVNNSIRHGSINVYTVIPNVIYRNSRYLNVNVGCSVIVTGSKGCSRGSSEQQGRYHC